MSRGRAGNARFRIGAPAAAVMLAAGCLSLDPFLFKGEELSNYQFDDYAGEQECSDAIDSLGPLQPSDTARLIMLASGPERIAALFLAPKTWDTAIAGSDTVILYFHGNAKHLDYYWPRVRLLHAAGYAVFAVDYRGYGMSSGTPTEEGLYEDGRAAVAFLRDSLGDPHLMVYAYSLGSIIGCETAYRDAAGRIDRLLLEAPIGSIQTLIEDGSYLNLPGSYLSTFEGDNAEKIKSIGVPLLWVHGTEDGTVYRETNGRAVWNNYHGQEGQYLRVIGGAHTTCPQTIGYARYRGAVRAFCSGTAGALYPALLGGNPAVEWGTK
jgi:pimeloyl-ACP methyl ester carboxylesterase